MGAQDVLRSLSLPSFKAFCSLSSTVHAIGLSKHDQQPQRLTGFLLRNAWQLVLKVLLTNTPISAHAQTATRPDLVIVRIVVLVHRHLLGRVEEAFALRQGQDQSDDRDSDSAYGGATRSRLRDGRLGDLGGADGFGTSHAGGHLDPCVEGLGANVIAAITEHVRLTTLRTRRTPRSRPARLPAHGRVRREGEQ